MLERLRERGFQVLALHHAAAILTHDMADAASDLEDAILKIEIPIEELIRGGGGEGKLTQRMRKLLSTTYEWRKHRFEIKKVVDGVDTSSTSHEIDHVKRFPSGTFALEIEWNNKDPFFDRDLENFKRLHADAAISIGAIITRGESLQDSLREFVGEYARRNAIDSLAKIEQFYRPTRRQTELIHRQARACGSFEEGWARAFVSDKFGQSTTHWRKLQDRVDRGVGNPCPLILIGIPRDVVIL